MTFLPWPFWSASHLWFLSPNDWLKKLTIEDVINLAGKYTVARMLERDDFSKRYQSNKPIAIHEFLNGQIYFRNPGKETITK